MDRDLVADILAMPWPKNEGVTKDVSSKKLRIQALSIALRHGRPLAVIDEFRALIEGDGKAGTLTDSNHLARLIPFFGTIMEKRSKALKFYSTANIFDGLSADGEWALSIMRGVKVGTFELVQLLLRARHTDAPYDHKVLNAILLESYNNAPQGFATLNRFLIHDDAAVNNKSCDLLIAAFFSLAQSFSCQCHVMERIGIELDTELVDSFFSSWMALHKNALKRISLCRQFTRTKFPSHNAIKVLFGSPFRISYSPVCLSLTYLPL